MQKKIYFFGEVNLESVKALIKDIDNQNNDPDCNEILLVLCSSGGDNSCVAAHDYIRVSIKPLDILAVGHCSSSAVTILQAGRKRYSTPNTTFVIHQGRMGLPSNFEYSQFQNISNNYIESYRRMNKIDADRVGISLDEYMQLIQEEKHLTAEQALDFGKFGLIDEIVNFNF